MRALGVLLVMLCVGCAALVRMEPLISPDQTVHYESGTPVIYSTGKRFGVALSPVTTSMTGRYKISSRLGVIIGVSNLADTAVDVDESSVSVLYGPAGMAGDPRVKGRVLNAADVEDEIQRNANWAHALAAFGGILDSANSRGYWQQRAAIADQVAVHSMIETNRLAASARVGGMFQRDTIQPGSSYGGAVLVDLNRYVCSYGTNRAPCSFRVVVMVAGERHSFDFVESLDAQPRRAVETVMVQPPPREVATMTLPSGCENLFGGGTQVTHVTAIDPTCTIGSADTPRTLRGGEIFRLIGADGTRPASVIIEDADSRRGATECRCIKPIL
jgi:hypothetical protein